MFILYSLLHERYIYIYIYICVLQIYSYYPKVNNNECIRTYGSAIQATEQNTHRSSWTCHSHHTDQGHQRVSYS